MTVEAVYMGKRGTGEYWVNVRNANPTGMIGDGGVIRRFDSKEAAQGYTQQVNSARPTSEAEYKMYQDMFVKETPQQPLTIRHQGDVFVSQNSAA